MFLEKRNSSRPTSSLCVLTRKPVILFIIVIAIVTVTGFASVKVDARVREVQALDRRKKKLSNPYFCYLFNRGKRKRTKQIAANENQSRYIFKKKLLIKSYMFVQNLSCIREQEHSYRHEYALK